MDIELLIKTVLDAAFEVKRTLGLGYLEAVYQNALSVELTSRGVPHERERVLDVYYKGTKVGVYRADIVVADCLIIELKVAESLTLANECQLVNYLQTTGIDYGLLLNFGTIPMEIKRKFRTKK